LSQPTDQRPSYVLLVLILVYVANFVDRQVLSILNEEIKRDLGVSDGEMGFLYGTAFAVFYALFGIPLGRLADLWVRRTLISVSLAVWSTMTTLSGFARNFTELAAARIGVGIGEAGASPAAFSLLSDLYPPAKRATALAFYSSGIYIGSGLSLMIGGEIVGRWDAAFPDGSAPLSLRGWQAAFCAVGLPGLLLAIWVRTLREPVRGALDGVTRATSSARPFVEFARELAAVIPPFPFFALHRSGGTPVLARNLVAAVALAMAGVALARWTGNYAQWGALGIGLYSAFSWTQALRLRDPQAARLILDTRSLRWATLGFSLLAFQGYGLGYWTPPFFLRLHEVPIARVGLWVGATAAVAGFIGVTTGGLLADALRRRSPLGRLHVAFLGALLPLPLVPWMLTTENTTLALALNFPISVAASMWVGVGAATVQNLVLPHMRATASAAYLLVVTFVGLAMGPYTIGKLSDVYGLRSAMLMGLLANAAAVVCLFVAARHLPKDEASLAERGRQ
jgi:MFS family permease